MYYYGVIFLKKKLLSIVRFLSICFLCGLMFVLGGYYYLNKSIKPADTDTESVPYTFSAPQNSGIIISINESPTFVYLDFEEEWLRVIIPPSRDFENEIYGYPIDYKIAADYDFVTALIDYAGGIELDIEGKSLRYTGVQVTDILSRTADTSELKRNIINSLLEKISVDGIDSEILNYIVEKTETNLSMPDCYYWDGYIKKLCSNGKIIN